MKKLIVVVGIICLGVGAYLGWAFKPSSAEGLLLSTIGGLTEGQAAAERAEYEARYAQSEQVLEERTVELEEAQEERERAEEWARRAGEQVNAAQVRLMESRKEARLAHTQTAQAIANLEQDPEDTTLLREALTTSQVEVVAVRADNTLLRAALARSQSQVVAEQGTLHAMRGELLASAREKMAIISQRDIALARVDQLTKRRVRVGPGITGGWPVFGGSLRSANVFAGITFMWG